MDSDRLRLALDPVLPTRTCSRRDGTRRHGYLLRLPGGPAIGRDDPLLTAYGAQAVNVFVDEDRDEAFQHESFEPGRLLRLEPEPFDPADADAVGVWDADNVRQCGALHSGADELVSAALEHGLPMEALAL